MSGRPGRETREGGKVLTFGHSPPQYQLYGEQVVKACISQKTNYVDITGEPYVSRNRP